MIISRHFARHPLSSEQVLFGFWRRKQIFAFVFIFLVGNFTLFLFNTNLFKSYVLTNYKNHNINHSTLINQSILLSYCISIVLEPYFNVVIVSFASLIDTNKRTPFVNPRQVIRLSKQNENWCLIYKSLARLMYLYKPR